MNIISDLKQEMVDLIKFKRVVYSFVSYTLRLRYRRSILGFVWTVLAPLLQYLVLGVVFSWALRMPMENYLTYFLSGLLLFNFINGVVVRAPNIFFDNEHYIKKIYLPKSVYILEIVSLEFVTFILTAISLISIGILIGRVHLDLSLLFLAVPIGFTILMLIGLTCILGISSVYFRDLRHIIPSALLGLFYGTPIMYPANMIPEKFSYLVTYNPLSYVIDCFRIPILHQRLPDINSILVMALFSLGMFVIGTYFLVKLSNKIVFKL